ncbi:hypothetical protein AXX12_16225 [Anaerosporomusa subterranea]|uniref:Uncharacterized protein n=1 Tax=Anaerosporomusa subterranea TaxID=1794912 RepID=A0A154BLQ4_ANASB|nr:hypothetical protein AXX12_16225 [Anaerosporomusa subterranea]
MLGGPANPAAPRTFSGTQAMGWLVQQLPNPMPSMAHSALAHPCASQLRVYRCSASLAVEMPPDARQTRRPSSDAYAGYASNGLAGLTTQMGAYRRPA